MRKKKIMNIHEYLSSSSNSFSLKLFVIPKDIIKYILSFVFKPWYEFNDNKKNQNDNESLRIATKNYLSLCLVCKYFYQISIELFDYDRCVEKMFKKKENYSFHYISLLLKKNKLTINDDLIRFLLEGNRVHSMELILKCNYDNDNDSINLSFSDDYPIRYASVKGYVDMIKLLLKNEKVNPSANYNEAIRKASEYGHFETVALLLTDKRVDPSDCNNYAIQYSSENGHSKVVELLLNDKRVDPSVYDNYAIRLASANGKLETVKLLLKNDKVNPCDKNNYAVQYAFKNDHSEVIKILLEIKKIKEYFENNLRTMLENYNQTLQIRKRKLHR